MTERNIKILSKIFEFGIIPIFILIFGLTIEYKTGIFQNVVDNKAELKFTATKPFEQNSTTTLDSIQSNIFDEGYSIFKQKEIDKFQTDIKVYNDIIKDERSTSQKIKGGHIYKTNDTVFYKTIGTNKVELVSTMGNLYNEIVTIKNGKFYRMRTMNDEYSSSINLTVLENLKNDFPVEQILIKVNNENNECKIVGYYHRSQKEKYLKSQKQIIDEYTDLMLFWRNIFD